MVLYGINESCVYKYNKKNIQQENILNTYIPLSCMIYSFDHAITVPLICCKNGRLSVTSLKREDIKLEKQEITYSHEVYLQSDQGDHHRFVNFPPDDLGINTGTMDVYESKTCVTPCHAKGKVFELIIRQNNIANCLRNVIKNNIEQFKIAQTLKQIITNENISESPYIFVYLWKQEGGKCSVLCFTDKALLRMIFANKTQRGKIVRGMIEEMLQEYDQKEKITYKTDKSDTVKHQKLTLYPVDYSDDIKTLVNTLEYKVFISDLVVGNVVKKRSLCDFIENAKLQKKVRELEEKLGL